jgi:predicted transcriptional regulator
MGDFSGENLGLAIRQSGVSKSELARRLKITPAAINTYIRTKNPSIEIWNKIYAAIGKEPIKQYSALEALQNPHILNEDDAPTYGQSATDYNLVGQLKELSELYKSGLLNEVEFAEAKEIIIKNFKIK